MTPETNPKLDPSDGPAPHAAAIAAPRLSRELLDAALRVLNAHAHTLVARRQAAGTAAQ